MVVLLSAFAMAQTPSPTPTAQLFFQDTRASLRGGQQIAVDSTGNVISFTIQFGTDCPFGTCGAVVYSIAPNGNLNWSSADPNYISFAVNQVAISPSDNIFFQDFFSVDKVIGLAKNGNSLLNWPIILGSELNTSSNTLLIDPVDQSILVKGGSGSAFAPSTRTAAFQLDGSLKWASDAPIGANNTPGLAFGPGNSVYTFTDHTLLLDRLDGHTICEFPKLGGDSFVAIAAGDGLAFSYTNAQLLRSDGNCIASPIYNWSTGNVGQVLAYDQGIVFAVEHPFGVGGGTLIAVSKDGIPLWRNPDVVAGSIAARSQGILYVVGLDALEITGDPVLFTIDENSGSVLNSIDLASICAGCGAGRIAVSGNNVYVADGSSTSIYKISGLTPVITVLNVPAGVGMPGPANPQATSAEPISTGNGNYFYQHADITVPGRGLPMIFSRTYNAQDTYSGPLGANWTHSYNVILATSSAGAVIKWGDGHGETFTLSGSVYVPPPGVHSSLIANTDDTFLLTLKNQTKFVFSASGSLASISDRNGNTIRLSYDGSGNLIQITDTVGRVLSISYDPSNRITQILDPIGRKSLFGYDSSNNLVSATDPAGGVTQYAYDNNHRVVLITLPNGNTLLQNTYDTQGRVMSQKNGRGFAWTYAYGSPAAGQTTITDPRGNTTIHIYDSLLRIVAITDALSNTTAFTYDSQNNRTSVTDANHHISTFTYDSQGNLLSAADPNGGIGVFTYDGLNDLLTATTPKGNTTIFTYDSVGNLTALRNALGNTTRFAFDLNGQLAVKTDANNHATSFTYDSAGNLAQITDALGHKRTLAYDAVGRLTSATDANGHTGTVTFDVLNRIIKIADPLGNATQFGFDAVGNLLSLTDANSHTIGYGYDAVNNLVSVTDALGHVTQYSYDSANNRTALKNAKLNTTAFAYDALNRLTSVSDPLGNTMAYVYDAVGNLAQTTDANSTTNRFTYDALNRLTGISYGDGKSVLYVYDPDSHRLSMTDSIGKTTYAYDANSHLISVTAPGNKTVNYTYDAIGNRIGLQYPDTKNLSYGYDAANRLINVTDWQLKITSYIYDPANNLVKTAYPNGASVSFSFDAASRLTNVINTASDGKPILNLAYTLDPVGNRTALSTNGIMTLFGYDVINELLSAQQGQLNSIWAYDAIGNRTQQVLPTGIKNYTYDSADRLLQAGTRSFTYDQNGNELSATDGLNGIPILYTYDATNHLISARAGTKINSSFVYDGDGNRVAQTIKKGTYAYVNDVAAQLPVVLQESGPDGQITYARGIGLIEEFSSSFNYFYHPDGLGSTIALSNNKGEQETGYTYDPWGNVLSSGSDDIGEKNKFRFTSEAQDPETQLYYFRARYYDPSIGHFISRDPLSIADQPYSYAFNNPLLFVDPLGLFSWPESFGQAELGFTDGAYAVAFSGVTIAKGTISGINTSIRLLTVGNFDGFTSIENRVGNIQQATAKRLLSKTALTLGIPVSSQMIDSDALALSTIGDISDTLLNLPEAFRGLSHLRTGPLGPLSALNGSLNFGQLSFDSLDLGTDTTNILGFFLQTENSSGVLAASGAKK
jgi:RHS repeat-associated protein